MERFLSVLRNKPYQYRRNISLGVAIGTTLVIFSVWAISTKERFNAHLEGRALSSATGTVSGVVKLPAVEPDSPIETISRTFFDGLETIKSQFEELSKITK